MKTIQWNRTAVELTQQQGVDDPLRAVCPACGTTPAMGQYGIYQCECGELEGFAPAALVEDRG
jgi:formate dehydrogenase maturation protein FdhE